VIWPPACENVSTESEEHPLLEGVPSAVKTVTENIGLCAICKVLSRVVC
jgi:hypothetical protein